MSTFQQSLPVFQGEEIKRALAFILITLCTSSVFADYPTEEEWEKREANWTRYVPDSHKPIRVSELVCLDAHQAPPKEFLAILAVIHSSL